MKVLFTFGGLPHYLIPILNKLDNVKNLDVVVVIPKNSSGTIGSGVKLENSGINFKLIYLNEKKSIFGKYYLSNLLETIKTENPSILVTHWPYILDLVVSFRLKRYLKKNNIKIILREIPFDVPTYKETFNYYKSYYARTLNEDMIENKKVNISFYIKHFILRTTRKYYYSNLVDAVLAYTDKANEVAVSFGLSKEKIFVSKNSQDTDILFAAKENIKNEAPILPKNKYRILHIGRLVKWKRVDLLIKAISILKPEIPDIELIVIGKGKVENNLKKQALELKVSDNVKFIGAIYGDEELGRYLNACSVYVLAGMGGLSINQAMIFNKPIICSIADGTEKHLVKNNYNGYYFKNGDAEDLANKIKQIIIDDNKIKKFGQNSLSIIKTEVNVYTVLSEFLNAFNYVSDNKYLLSL